MEEIEDPMRMNYREAFAWQLGYAKGFEICRTENNNFLLELEKQLKDLLKLVMDNKKC